MTIMMPNASPALTFDGFGRLSEYQKQLADQELAKLTLAETQRKYKQQAQEDQYKLADLQQTAAMKQQIGQYAGNASIPQAPVQFNQMPEFNPLMALPGVGPLPPTAERVINEPVNMPKRTPNPDEMLDFVMKKMAVHNPEAYMKLQEMQQGQADKLVQAKAAMMQKQEENQAKWAEKKAAKRITWAKIMMGSAGKLGSAPPAILAEMDLTPETAKALDEAAVSFKNNTPDKNFEQRILRLSDEGKTEEAEAAKHMYLTLLSAKQAATAEANAQFRPMQQVVTGSGINQVLPGSGTLTPVPDPVTGKQAQPPLKASSELLPIDAYPESEVLKVIATYGPGYSWGLDPATNRGVIVGPEGIDYAKTANAEEVLKATRTQGVKQPTAKSVLVTPESDIVDVMGSIKGSEKPDLMIDNLYKTSDTIKTYRRFQNSEITATGLEAYKKGAPPDTFNTPEKIANLTMAWKYVQALDNSVVKAGELAMFKNLAGNMAPAGIVNSLKNWAQGNAIDPLVAQNMSKITSVLKSWYNRHVVDESIAPLADQFFRRAIDLNKGVIPAKKLREQVLRRFARIEGFDTNNLLTDIKLREMFEDLWKESNAVVEPGPVKESGAEPSTDDILRGIVK